MLFAKILAWLALTWAGLRYLKAYLFWQHYFRHPNSLLRRATDRVRPLPKGYLFWPTVIAAVAMGFLRG